MNIKTNLTASIVAIALSALLGFAIIACTSPEPTATPVAPTPTPSPDYSAYADVPGIVDPTNFDWPRQIESEEGVITIEQPPEVVHFASLGHAEIGFALMETSRIAAVYSFFSDPEISNIADHVEGLTVIGYEPEEVVALEPDVIVASKFTNPDLIAVFQAANLPVFRTALEGSDGDIPNILLIAYAVGEEDRGLKLVEEVQNRLDFVRDRIAEADIAEADRTSVLSASKYFTDIWVAGTGSNVHNIIEDAGGVNAASEIADNQQISIESIAAMNPDVIILTQPMESGLAFADELRASPVLQDVGAVQNDEIYVVGSPHFTTLSHWNVRGIETLAKLLNPELFDDIEFENYVIDLTE